MARCAALTLGSAQVGASRYRVKNSKLAAWQRYAGWLMLAATVFMILGAFAAITTVQRTMNVKSPVLWASAACAEQGWYAATDPVSQRRM